MFLCIMYNSLVLVVGSGRDGYLCILHSFDIVYLCKNKLKSLIKSIDKMDYIIYNSNCKIHINFLEG